MGMADESGIGCGRRVMQGQLFLHERFRLPHALFKFSRLGVVDIIRDHLVNLQQSIDNIGPAEAVFVHNLRHLIQRLEVKGIIENLLVFDTDIDSFHLVKEVGLFLFFVPAARNIMTPHKTQLPAQFSVQPAP